MATIPYREALLMKRMAWRNLQPRKPSEADAIYVPTAVQMLTCIACLDYAMCDMEQELTDAGMMRHAVKRAFVRCFNEVVEVHSIAARMLGQISTVAERQYNDQLEEAWRVIDGCILVAPPHRAYSIVSALCRIIEKLNLKLSGRYDFAPARGLYRIPHQLSCSCLTDYNLDSIIERNLEQIK